MNILRTTQRIALLVMVIVAAPGAFGAGAEIKMVDAVADGDAVRIDIELTSTVKPLIRVVGRPSRLILDFPNVTLASQSGPIRVNHGGVGEVWATNHAAPRGTRIVVEMDSARPFGMETGRNKLALRILPHPTQANATNEKRDFISSDKLPVKVRAADANPGVPIARNAVAVSTNAAPPQVEHQPVVSEIDEMADDCPATVRHRFRIKFIAGNTSYIDGGSNAGLRVGMNLDIRNGGGNSGDDEGWQSPIAAARIVGVATTSAILEVGRSEGEPKVGDWADLPADDADAARKNVITGPGNTLHVLAKPADGDQDATVEHAGKSFRPAHAAEAEPGERTAGRIGIDYSGISSSGSTPGGSAQVGMSFQSDIRQILGSHWNLEGYWRGRINRHSQFREPTIEDSLNKTYTMELYYENPNSRWVAGLGRLYLPWAVSLDTIDGGYFGRKFPFRNTSGVFAGSTPDLNSWHYRPNQRIGGIFTNFEGGDYDRFHYSSTTGAALTSIQWKLDRPYAFFENELSYKGQFSAYHSLIVDSPRGVSTNGIRPGAGVSHSYLTLHYQPKSIMSFDLYHNFFRDVPTAVTSLVGTGLVDKLLFQGISAGTHIRPSRYFTLYTTLGTSEKTGDTRRTLNQMFGATLNEVGRTGIRADFHYSKFDSNFGYGHYGVLSLSRQVTNRMFWNVQLGKQAVVSSHTLDCFSNFVDDSIDINLGRHSYMQSGFTYVKGDTLNYRQWFMSWGYRFDGGKNTPQYVKTLMQR